MINSNKVKGKMRELGLTQKKVATELKIAEPTVNQKINNQRPFTLSEIEDLIKILKIPNEEFNHYFFYHPVA